MKQEKGSSSQGKGRASSKEAAPETPTQELLGGPYDPGEGFTTGGRVAAALGLPNPIADMAQQAVDRANDPSRRPSYVEEPPEPFPGVTPGINPDESQGGSNIEDPEAAAQAAADDTPSEEMTVTAEKPKKDIRPFLDQDFILMHAYNLVNLRTEKENIALDPIKVADLADVDGDNKGDDVALNTIRSIKAPMAYAYYPTPSHPKEVNAAIQCIGDPGGSLII